MMVKSQLSITVIDLLHQIASSEYQPIYTESTCTCTCTLYMHVCLDGCIQPAYIVHCALVYVAA